MNKLKFDNEFMKLFLINEGQLFHITHKTNARKPIKAHQKVGELADKNIYSPVKPLIKTVTNIEANGYYISVGDQDLYRVALVTTDQENANKYMQSDFVALIATDSDGVYYLAEIEPSNKLKALPLVQNTANERLERAEILLQEFLGCPYMADEVTRRNGFDVSSPEHRKQLIVNMSCSYDRLYRVKEFLNEA